MIAGLVAIALPAVACWLLLTSRLARPGIDWRTALAMSPALGLGVSSCVYFFLLWGLPTHRAAVRADVALWALASGALLAARVRNSRTADVARVPGVAWSWRIVPLVLATLSLIVVTGVALQWIVAHYRLMPLGEWDSWAVWNLRARALARGAPDWPDIFSSQLAWSNVNYPLLVPLSIARMWGYMGAETPIASQVFGLVMFGSTIATLVLLVAQAGGWTAGMLAGIALLVPRTYVFQASCQCADVPLAFYVLVAIAFAAAAISSHSVRAGSSLLFVSGLSAGLAAWTKNEGLLVLLVVAAGSAVLMMPWKRPAWFAFAGGAVLPGLAVLAFKLLLSPSNALFADGAVPGIQARLLDISRWRLVVDRSVAGLGSWGEVAGGAIAVVSVIVVLLWTPTRDALVRALIAAAMLCVVFGGYLAVYVIAPAQLEWLIATSFERLVVHLWPAWVWAIFQPVSHLSES